MPGKFNSVNDEAIYALSLDGGESVGDAQTIGAVWTRVVVPESFDYVVPFTSRTRVHAGTYIVREDSQGFVAVVGFATEPEGYCAEDVADLEKRWENILQEIAQFEGDDTEL